MIGKVPAASALSGPAREFATASAAAARIPRSRSTCNAFLRTRSGRRGAAQGRSMKAILGGCHLRNVLTGPCQGGSARHPVARRDSTLRESADQLGNRAGHIQGEAPTLPRQIAGPDGDSQVIG
jgi:hypothetical protein